MNSTDLKTRRAGLSASAKVLMFYEYSVYSSN